MKIKSALSTGIDQNGDKPMRSIKEIRMATGLSRSEFCEILGLPKRTLEKWELGERNCPPYVVDLIAYRVQHDPEFRVEEKT